MSEAALSGAPASAGSDLGSWAARARPLEHPRVGGEQAIVGPDAGCEDYLARRRWASAAASRIVLHAVTVTGSDRKATTTMITVMTTAHGATCAHGFGNTD
ncbi:hypothetical protein GCM10010524_11120 [Streptomyces mexicanus]